MLKEPRRKCCLLDSHRRPPAALTPLARSASKQTKWMEGDGGSLLYFLFFFIRGLP